MEIPFPDRRKAGQWLANALEHYKKDPDAIVLGLPRGGVPVAFEVAKALELPLDIVYPRKIGAPGNPEYAIGAITEHGQGILHQDVVDMLGVSQEYLQEAIAREKAKAQARLKIYRSGRPALTLEGKKAIVVDDGIATGSTMEAAIASLREINVEQVIVAVPVAPFHSIETLRNQVDEVVCLATPDPFYAVGQFYQEFGQTSDEEVIALMRL